MLMEKEGALGWIIFNQPEKRNAVSQEMWQMIPDERDLFELGYATRRHWGAGL
jgi:enoyl-CoA hydratase